MENPSEKGKSEHSAADEGRQKVKLKKWGALGDKFGGKSEDAPEAKETPSVGILELFKFSTPLDVFLIVTSIFLGRFH
jgi:hypothetical protein